MTKIDRDTIKKLAKLSHIHCAEVEEEELLQDLRKILNYMDQLQEVDTEGVEACCTVLEGMTAPMREDIVGACLDRDAFLANAPEHIDGMIKVPSIIKKTKKPKLASNVS
jgi:aspartyl-tRNA(Asn)/glutamyl-tRNA(Gln) amidotransferase subunit C